MTFDKDGVFDAIVRCVECIHDLSKGPTRQPLFLKIFKHLGLKKKSSHDIPPQLVFSLEPEPQRIRRQYKEAYFIQNSSIYNCQIAKSRRVHPRVGTETGVINQNGKLVFDTRT